MTHQELITEKNSNKQTNKKSQGEFNRASNFSGDLWKLTRIQMNSSNFQAFAMFFRKLESEMVPPCWGRFGKTCLGVVGLAGCQQLDKSWHSRLSGRGSSWAWLNLYVFDLDQPKLWPNLLWHFINSWFLSETKRGILNNSGYSITFVFCQPVHSQSLGSGCRDLLLC